MVWLADECVGASLVRQLCQSNEDVLYIAEHSFGTSDADVLRLAATQNRLLLTEDKDFGDLVFRLRMPASGCVLVRIPLPQPGLKWLRLKAAIERYGTNLFGRYLVIEESRFRSRLLTKDAT